MRERAVLFDLISARAGWLAQRQAVLGQNVANADTPGFRPLDLAPASFERLLQGEGGLDLALTALGHMTDAGAAAARFRAREVDSYETAPSGNAVVLPEQLQKMASNELDYQLTTHLYRRYVALLRTAIGAPQA